MKAVIRPDALEPAAQNKVMMDEAVYSVQLKTPTGEKLSITIGIQGRNVLCVLQAGPTGSFHKAKRTETGCDDRFLWLQCKWSERTTCSTI